MPFFGDCIVLSRIFFNFLSCRRKVIFVFFFISFRLLVFAADIVSSIIKSSSVANSSSSLISD